MLIAKLRFPDAAKPGYEYFWSKSWSSRQVFCPLMNKISHLLPAVDLQSEFYDFRFFHKDASGIQPFAPYAHRPRPRTYEVRSPLSLINAATHSLPPDYIRATPICISIISDGADSMGIIFIIVSITTCTFYWHKSPPSIVILVLIIIYGIVSVPRLSY